MRTRFAILMTVLSSVFCVGYIAQGQIREKPVDSARNPAAAPRDDKKPAVDPDEQSIRAGAEVFVKLYNAHDAKGLSQLFAAKAEIIDESDNVTKGREAIEKVFQRVFKQHPKASMEIDVETVRVMTPSLAIEEGTTRSKQTPDSPETASVYVTIHAKIDGKWQIVCVRDWDAPPTELSPHDRLEQNLSWMIGEWVDESRHSNIHSVCSWDETGNFLVQNYQVNIGGTVVNSGSTRIGWNAATKQFQSWVFDSNGGHAIGAWLLDGERWLIKMQGVTATGEIGAATNYYRPIDSETVAWGSFNRIQDGERLADVPEVIVKRRAPQPAE